MFVVHDVEQRAKAHEKTENESETFIRYRVNRVGFSTVNRSESGVV